MADFNDRFNAMEDSSGVGQAFPGGPYNPALGAILATNPKVIIPHLLARAQKPPPDIPKDIDANDVGRALSFAPTGGRLAPVTGGLQPAPGDTPADQNVPPFPQAESPFAPKVVKPIVVTPPKDQERVRATEAVKYQPNAPETTIEPPAAPKVKVQQTDVTTNTDTPPPPGADESKSQQTDGLSAPGATPTPAGSGYKGLDSLAQALSGVHAMTAPPITHVSTPWAPRPSNVISRSTAPQVLMQELASATRPLQVLRLGQALRGG